MNIQFGHYLKLEVWAKPQQNFKFVRYANGCVGDCLMTFHCWHYLKLLRLWNANEITILERSDTLQFSWNFNETSNLRCMKLDLLLKVEWNWKFEYMYETWTFVETSMKLQFGDTQCQWDAGWPLPNIDNTTGSSKICNWCRQCDRLLLLILLLLRSCCCHCCCCYCRCFALIAYATHRCWCCCCWWCCCCSPAALLASILPASEFNSQSI